jgi:hypothetical protein
LCLFERFAFRSIVGSQKANGVGRFFILLDGVHVCSRWVRNGQEVADGDWLEPGKIGDEDGAERSGWLEGVWDEFGFGRVFVPYIRDHYRCPPAFLGVERGFEIVKDHLGVGAPQ